MAAVLAPPFAPCAAGGVALAERELLTRRVARVRHTLAALGAGDLGTRLAVDDMDDLRPLAEGFNRTAEALAAATAALERRASQDPLTGLANRAGLGAALRDALRDGPGDGPGDGPAAVHTAGRASERATVAVLAVDLDGFKAVNDSHGHAAGDRVLQAVAARLLDATRGSDLVARPGGDEVVVLLRQVRGADEACLVAERVVAAAATPVPLGDGGTARLGASVGIALAGRGGAPDAVGAAQLRDADRALYHAKTLGRGRAVLFGAPARRAA